MRRSRRGALVLVLTGLGACAPEPAGSSSTRQTSDASTSTEASESASESAGPLDLPPEPPPPDTPPAPEPPAEGCAQLELLLDELDATPSPDAGLALIDEFIALQVYGEHGFPLVDADRLCVLYRGADAASIALAGDFNGWDPSATPLSAPLPGFSYAIVELDAAPAGLYKLVHPGDDYRADPLARRFGWDEFGEYSQVEAIEGRDHHERYPAFAQGAGALQPRTLTLWLPAQAQQARDEGAALPVIYMHDGQNLFAPDALWGGWQVSATLAEAVESQLLAPVVIAALDNTSDRMDEYTQVGDLLDGQPVGGRASEYADFLVQGVMPFVEARYPVATEAAGVGVLGSSLGGLVSLYIGQRHRDRFGHAGSMSGTIAFGTFGAQNPTIVDDYLADPPAGLRIYLDSGGDPGGGCPSGGSDNYCGNVELADALRQLGWVDEQDLFYRWQPGAPHNEAAWASRLLPALLDWFPGAA